MAGAGEGLSAVIVNPPLFLGLETGAKDRRYFLKMYIIIFHGMQRCYRFC